MDEAVNLTSRACLMVLASLAWSPAALLAETLPDPTRPPAHLSASSTSATTPAAAALPQLQSVLVARHAGGRHVAVIDGQTVRQGEMIKGAKLESVTETQVVLLRGNQRQVLRLFPASTPAQR